MAFAYYIVSRINPLALTKMRSCPRQTLLDNRREVAHKIVMLRDETHPDYNNACRILTYKERKNALARARQNAR